MAEQNQTNPWISKPKRFWNYQRLWYHPFQGHPEVNGLIHGIVAGALIALLYRLFEAWS